MNRAIGFLEVLGYSVALAAMDKACKSADIRVEGIDCNNPAEGDRAHIPVVIQVKLSGTVSDVKVALEMARLEASKYMADQDILTHYIPAATEEIMKLLPLGKVKRKSWHSN
ncbi:BMC domain-containing protein [Peribacillus acanthi]|uniref:BMC domain-containing protein n=1 Tax=Peribacillus acanthi TaxID=2171554 RepID=UPI000D3E3513|nr:BMC domain-containing protein [Peribacillus acanthi]